MEIIMINESKLKVMLTSDDLQGFEITTDELDYSNTETKRMFWDILNRAKHSIGFDTDGQRVLVQLYPSRGGGCEMFITKIGTVPLPDEVDTQAAPAGGALLHYKPSHRQNYEKGKTGAFGFDSMELMLKVCRRLFIIGYTGESSAYIGDNSRVYLFLSGLDPTVFPLLDEYSFIAEYGTPENPENLMFYIEEHGKEICMENAVEILSAF